MDTKGQNVSKKLSILDLIKNNKTIKYVVICILFIVLVLLFFSGTFNKESQDVSEDTLIEYSKRLEERLSDVLSEVSGAGEVEVVISFEGGSEKVLAMKTITKDLANCKEIEETPIVVNGKTVVLKELAPKISGVLIVCEGANNIAVRSKLVSATKSLLDVENEKIEILTMK